MFQAVDSPYLVPNDGTFRVASAATSPPGDAVNRKEAKRLLAQRVAELGEQQRMLYAADSWSVLLIFQAMDAAGKDSTIRHVMSGINPAGCQVFSFKEPSHLDLEHDFLWRTSSRAPERGRIGVFNRSYYEEVLVVRVHPELLDGQRLPRPVSNDELWAERYQSIRDHELHLARNGTVLLKFWLNISREEQRRRFLSRIKEPRKHWKFSAADVRERAHWTEYQHAYEQVLNATSRSWAPWYAIPADDKPTMRLAVADIMLKSLQSLNLTYPEVGEETRAELERMRRALENED